MSRTRVNELSECYATAEYFDVDKVPFTPALVRYKVDDLTHNALIVPYTPIVGPGTFTRVAITSPQNAMMNGGLSETRRVTFEVTAPGGGITYPCVEYDLVRTNPQ